ncbi:MAG: flagellar filament capping protein FliD [Nitrospinae bacterium]|nr:flagellar filament capping protein FliD [Nitrospinota bacterium]MDA1109206.1 flagellar filament capping protein FliD [Nitrospinota bacterium]
MQVTGSQNSAFLFFTPTPGSRSSPSFAEPQAKIALTETPRSNKRDILFDSVNKSSAGINSLEATGPFSRLRAADAVKILSQSSSSQRLPIADGLEQTSRFLELKRDRLNDLKSTLQNLQSRVSRLQGEDALNFRSGKSSKRGVVQVATGKNSPVTNFSVRADRLAQVDVLVSDAQTTGALGLSGSFFINGTKVTVESSDSVFDIRNKINFGEDQNHNGALDRAEDLNGNAVLETYSVAGSTFGPGVYVNEDTDGDGALDPTEDSNNNERLDGGSAETKVVASVRENRLVFTSLTGSDTRIDLRDEDDVLLALGFFESDRKGNSVLRERQYDSGNPPVNLNKSPESAQIEVDGQPVTSASNTFQNVAEDTTLTVKQTSERQAEVRIFIDASDVVSKIQTLFGQFNAAVITLNDLLAQSRTFQSDQQIQRIREHLVESPQEKTRQLNQRNGNIDAVRGKREYPGLIGIDVQNTDKNRVQEQTLSSVISALKSGGTPSIQSAERTLIQRLTSIGIKTLQDDTFVVDREKLDRALNINSEEVLDLLNNPENGILPLLDKQLNRILESGPGDSASNRQANSLSSKIPNFITAKLRQFEESSTLKRTTQTLIAVA